MDDETGNDNNDNKLIFEDVGELLTRPHIVEEDRCVLLSDLKAAYCGGSPSVLLRPVRRRLHQISLYDMSAEAELRYLC